LVTLSMPRSGRCNTPIAAAGTMPPRPATKARIGASAEISPRRSVRGSVVSNRVGGASEVETRVLRQERAPVPADAGRALGPGERNAILVERVAILSHEPVALLQAYLSPRAFPGLLTEPLVSQSLYETLRSRYGTVVTRAESVIELARASSAEADKLGIPAGEPLLKVEGTAFADSGAAVEYFRVLYRGDRVRFHLDSHRESDRVVRLVSSHDTGQRAAGRGARAARGDAAADSGPQQSSAGAS